MTVIPPLTGQEVRDLARRIVDDEVFVARDADDLKSFPVLLFMSLPENAALVWESWSEVSPWAMNGRPKFLSCHFVPAESVDALTEAVLAEAGILQ